MDRLEHNRAEAVAIADEAVKTVEQLREADATQRARALGAAQGGVAGGVARSTVSACGDRLDSGRPQ